MNEPTELDLAIQSLREAKANEEQARNMRLKAEETILQMVGFKEEGTTTIKTEYFKVSTVGKLTRTLLADELQKVQAEMDPKVFGQIVKYKPELSLSGLKAVEKANPEAYSKFIAALVTKPAKASVSVELLGA